MSGTIRLPRWQVDWLLQGALAAASTDDVTPVLTGVHWTVGEGRVTVIATDRYRVHQLYVPAPEGAPDGTFLMEPHQANLLRKLQHSRARRLSGEAVELTWVDPEPWPVEGVYGTVPRRFCGSIAFRLLSSEDADADVLSGIASQIRGKFPPVWGLFPDADAAGTEQVVRAHDLLLKPEHLAKTAHLRVSKGEPLRFVYPPSGDGKQQPVLVENIQGTARAMLQPFLISLHDVKGYGNG